MGFGDDGGYGHVSGDVGHGFEHVGDGVGGDEEAETFGGEAELLIEREGDEEGAGRDAGASAGD